MHTYSLTDLCNSPSPALSLCANLMHSDTIPGYVFVQERGILRNLILNLLLGWSASPQRFTVT